MRRLAKNKERRMPRIAALLLLAALTAPVAAEAQDKVNFGLDWKAEAEYGGYYQAVAAGIYARHGLEVAIRQGGPQLNQAQMLLAGRLDFNLASNSYLALNFAQQDLPFLAVAAIYQKDPSVLIAHPGQGNDSFSALKGKPIMIGADTRAGWWNFLRARFGYSDSQIRPYTFNLAPFLADKRAIQQGYVGSEPFSIQEATGIRPVVLLIADAGFSGYGSLITTSRKLVQFNPDLVQRFVNASIEGWYSYLYGDPAPANALILRENPEMTQSLLDYGRGALIDRGIVDSGDALTAGIGAMTDARWQGFFESMAAAGLYPRTLDYRRAYTLEFVNKRDGTDMKPAR
jgi:NitT/TauT family transport system substrate-binding protein